MSITNKVKAMLASSGKRQIDMAAEFGMGKQSFNNKIRRDSWSANDLAKAAEFCGARLVLVMPDGSNINIDSERDRTQSPQDNE